MNPVTKHLGRVVDLGHPWRGVGPFIFVVHHRDTYPKGEANLGPDPSLLKGRNIGMDMSNDLGTGWNMYHGKTVPGFPAHPHRGFETVSVCMEGYVDHADSTGAGARYGAGDTQWVTAGRGVSHSEMFPLVHKDKGNTFELYQIWLNLPSAKKLSPPEFWMLWKEKTPIVRRENNYGVATVRVMAGKFDNVEPAPPPVNSYAADPESDVAIWLIEMEPRSSIKLPACNLDTTQRLLYVHQPGAVVDISGTAVSDNNGFLQEAPKERLTITNGPKPARILVLQGVDIGEPVAQHGPFVMNTQKELEEGFAEYRRTQFGGWPWPSDQPIYPATDPRFAKHGDGKTELPEGRDAIAKPFVYTKA